ncbi:Tic22-like family protein [Perilla frutescens var. hirtella]|uniref:Tic22-like family protein n=1 Tax=Perilla frutescens var. hirtella TaxID=608512 RepID=A0AAD4JJP2_PERFH|nr:Tic22-like family protein [Perilla frutescens var. hirtella]
MASADDNRHRRRHPAAPFTGFLHTAAASLSSFLSTKGPYSPPPSSKIHLPLLLPDSVLSLTSPSDSTLPDSPPSTRSRTPPSSSSSSIKSMPSSEPGSGFPSTIRISSGKGAGPAFVGQVFSMCDLSGTGLMAVSTHFDIPFLSKRTPEWLKKMFAAVTKSERNGPVFRFFMDLGDAVSYVKTLNIPSGVVGACRLDIAYEHFKEKPDLFQFVPNERQVKEANKLLKILPQSNGKKKVEGVPVFSAQNMDIAIATKDGIKWYTPYFFDKKMLDNILEESVDQHFHALIETRNSQRRRDVVDDNLSAEVAEEMGESMWDPPEVQEVLDEIGHPGIPLSVISKAAEIQLLYAVDKVLLGNRWLRKATGIQPKFPYVIDSFQRKSAAAFLRARNPPHTIANSNFGEDAQLTKPDSLVETKNSTHHKQQQRLNFQFPFGDWSSHPWLKQQENQQNQSCSREQELQLSPFLPKITMVGISTGESGKMQKANIKKMMDDLTSELEKAEQVNHAGTTSNESTSDERDPLFVANVGDHYSGVSKTGSTRWVRGGSL